MKFFVYHNFHNGIFLFLCHNLKDRIVDEEKKYVCGYYNDVFVEFYFQSFTDLPREELLTAYHIIYREDAIKKWFFIDNFGKYEYQLGFPECLKPEYQTLIDEIDFDDKKWVLFWNFGENKFIHIPEDRIERNRELKLLKEISEKTIFFSDNFINEDSSYAIPNPKKINHALTNDIFMWNHLAEITWANEFRNIFKNLSPPNKLAISFRSYKPHRFELIKKLGSENLSELYLSYSSALFERFQNTIDKTWDIDYNKKYEELKKIPNVNVNNVGFHNQIDFENINVAGNKYSNMELDYYFRILPQGKVQLLDETHAYSSNPKTPMNLSEKTYIYLLANIPFISTHHYPFDLIKKHILDLEYPYYEDMVKVSNDTDELIKFIKKFLDNFDEMYPKIKEWTNKLHKKLINEIYTKNSFLEHMTTKI